MGIFDILFGNENDFRWEKLFFNDLEKLAIKVAERKLIDNKVRYRSSGMSIVSLSEDHTVHITIDETHNGHQIIIDDTYYKFTIEVEAGATTKYYVDEKKTGNLRLSKIGNKIRWGYVNSTEGVRVTSDMDTTVHHFNTAVNNISKAIDKLRDTDIISPQGFRVADISILTEANGLVNKIYDNALKYHNTASNIKYPINEIFEENDSPIRLIINKYVECTIINDNVVANISLNEYNTRTIWVKYILDKNPENSIEFNNGELIVTANGDTSRMVSLTQIDATSAMKVIKQKLNVVLRKVESLYDEVLPIQEEIDRRKKMGYSNKLNDINSRLKNL